MPIVYKIDVLAELKEKGYSTYKLRKDHLLSEATIQLLRHNKLIDHNSLAKVCKYLQCQPGDILEYKEESN